MFVYQVLSMSFLCPRVIILMFTPTPLVKAFILKPLSGKFNDAKELLDL